MRAGDRSPSSEQLAEERRTDLASDDERRDREHIAACAAASARERGERPPLCRLSGQVPFEFDPRDRQDRVYAVASGNGCQY